MAALAIVGYCCLQLASAVESAEAVVRRAEHAHRAGTDAALAAEWRRRATTSGDLFARLGLATLARLRDELTAADGEYRAILEHPSSGAAVQAALGRGHLGLYRIPFAEAADRYRRAAAMAEAARDTAAWAEALVGAATARVRGHSPAAAEASFALAERLLPATSDRVRARWSCDRAASLAVTNQRLMGAVAAAGTALARRAGEPGLESECLAMAGWYQSNLGNTEPARKLFDSAVAVGRRSRTRYPSALAHWWRGQHALEHYQHDAARRDLATALDEATRAGNEFLMGWSHLRMTVLLWHFSDFANARAELAAARRHLELQGDVWGLGVIRSVHGSLLLDGGDLAGAERAFREGLEWSERGGIPLEIFSARYGLARLAARRGDWTGAEAEFARAEAVARASRLIGYLPQLEYERGILALRRGELDRAERSFGTILAPASKAPALARYAARARMAEIHMAAGRIDAAEREAFGAAVALDDHRTTLDEEELRILAFQAHRGYDDPDLGFSGVIAGLVRAGRLEAAFQLAERRRARELRDNLLRLGDHPVAPPADPTPSIAEMTRRVPPGTAAVLFVAGRQGAATSALVFTSDGPRARLLAPLDSLADDVAALLDFLEIGEPAPEIARRLGQRLLDPIATDLPSSVEQLVLISDGGLHRVPFEAIRLADGRLAIERFSLSTAPSLTIAAAAWRRPAFVPGRRILAIGDPALSRVDQPVPGSLEAAYLDGFAATGGLPGLPASAREARAVARYAARAVVWRGTAATEAAFKAFPLDSFGVIHLATHALVDDRRPALAALALAPGGGDDGFVGAAELARLRLDGALVVLSACRTARGWIVEGEGIQGLTAPLLRAGAGAIVATRWRVPDGQVPEFVTGIYRGLAAGMPLGRALREAQLAAARKGTSIAVWAAFTTIGDGNLVVPLQEPSEMPLGPVAGAAVAGILLAGYLVSRRTGRGRLRMSEPSSSRATTVQ